MLVRQTVPNRLSEYQPQSNVVIDATAPPGVDRIKVCFDLTSSKRKIPKEFLEAYVYPKPLIMRLLTKRVIAD